MSTKHEIDVSDLAMPIEEVARCLPKLQQALADNPDGTIFITDQEDRTTMVLVSWDGWQFMAGIAETLEVMADKEAMAALLQAKADHAAGTAEYIPGAVAMQRLADKGVLDPAQL